MMKHIDAVIDSLRVVPHQKFVVDFLFNQDERPEGDVQGVKIEYVSLVPLLEAIGARMRLLRDAAFDEETGKIEYPDLVLDLNGLFMFLHAYFKEAHNAGHPLKSESIETLLNALKELAPLVEQAVSMSEELCDVCDMPFSECPAEQGILDEDD